MRRQISAKLAPFHGIQHYWLLPSPGKSGNHSKLNTVLIRIVKMMIKTSWFIWNRKEKVKGIYLSLFLYVVCEINALLVERHSWFDYWNFMHQLKISDIFSGFWILKVTWLTSLLPPPTICSNLMRVLSSCNCLAACLSSLENTIMTLTSSREGWLRSSTKCTYEVGKKSLETK